MRPWRIQLTYPKVGRLSLFAAALVALLAFSSLGRASTVPTTHRIPASIASDCSVDVTSAITSWIARVPNHSILAFSPRGCYRIEGTLELRNRSGLYLAGNGATFRSFDAPTDQRAIWRVIDSSGFVFDNMKIIGSYADGGVFNPVLQHAHAIDLRGTSAQVVHVTMRNLAGDCVYFGLGYRLPLTRSSGSVRDSSCMGTSRNAVSLTAAHDVTVTRVTTNRIGLSVFDVEPNAGPGWGSTRATFAHNTLGSYFLYAFVVVENAPVTDQSFNDNTVSGRGIRIAIVPAAAAAATTGYRASGITISGNRSSTPQWPAAVEIHDVDGVSVTGNSIPLTFGTLVTLEGTCSATVSGNTYAGGTTQVVATEVPSSCPALPTR